MINMQNIIVMYSKRTCSERKLMIHLYYGDGKGKTTAAMGLALRAIGHGKRVAVVQFLKNGKSGELAPLKLLGAFVLSGEPETKFYKNMSKAEREETGHLNNENLKKALVFPCDMLILDEACAACRLGMVDEDLLRDYVTGTRRRGDGEACTTSGEGDIMKEVPSIPEIVLTGREPAQWMLDAADYITEMKAERHPYEHGVRAREGIEY